jgi:two-component system LytT family response regulator
VNELSVLIVDDEPLARLRLRQLLSDVGGARVAGEAADAATAQRLLRETRPDVVLLDVDLGGSTGLDLVAGLLPGEIPAVVFVTAHHAHAVRAFELEAVDYVLKPVRVERLAAALDRVRGRRRREAAERAVAALSSLGAAPSASGPIRQLQVEDGRRTLVLPVDQIDWIEAEDKYVRVHAGAASYLRRSTVQQIEALLDGGRFLRVHRRLLVNLARVTEVERFPSGDALLRLRSGGTLRLSRSYRAAFERATGGRAET